MGGTCRMHEKWEMHEQFLLEDLKEKDHLQALRINKRRIFKQIGQTNNENVVWTEVAEDRVQ